MKIGHRRHRNGMPVYMMMPTPLNRTLKFPTHYNVLICSKDECSINILLITVKFKVVGLRKGAPMPCRSVASEAHVDVVIEP
jgi:hypothetical protein